MLVKIIKPEKGVYTETSYQVNGINYDAKNKMYSLRLKDGSGGVAILKENIVFITPMTFSVKGGEKGRKEKLILAIKNLYSMGAIVEPSVYLSSVIKKIEELL